ncbi:hypothetical protein ABK736_20425 [Klebsiella aerogenes]|uniref:hypothetical protein n=1 Tax=Klebsiella aerogenes TaxID=548 RepID=UPI0037516D18
MEDLHHKQSNQQVYGYQANADAGQVSPAPARHTATTIIKFIVIHITLVALSLASGTKKTSALNLWRWMAAGCHNETGSLNPFGYEKSRWLGGSEFVDVIHASCRAACSPCGFMLHPLAGRVVSNSPLRCAKYEGVFSLFELNSITLKECLHPFMCRVARFPAPLFKFWLHVSPKLAHRIIVVCHKTLCRYPLMREKCLIQPSPLNFEWTGINLFALRTSHLVRVSRSHAFIALARG